MSQPRPGPLHLAQASPQAPPIVELVRLAGRSLTVSYGLLSRTTVAFALSLIAPISLFYGPMRYLLAPVFVLLQVLFNVFVRTPYAVVQAIAHDVYPLYVFVGAACICAAVVGFAARMLSVGLKALLLAPRSSSRSSSSMYKEGEKVQGPEVQDTKGKSAMKPVGSTPKTTRVRRRVSIKEETDA